MKITPARVLVDNAKAEIETLSINATRKLYEAGEAVLVDIRDIRELDREGRVPGAFHAPRGMLEFWIDPASPYHKPELITDKKLVLFCAGALRSSLAVKALQDMGVPNIAEMDGGFSGWKSSGAPVETG